MKTLAVLALLGTVLLAACTEPDTYPVSGEPCAPGDAVKTVDPLTCVPT